MLYAGVDTHKHYSKVVVTDSTGNRVAQASLQNDAASFKDFSLSLNEPTRAVLEAGRTWGVIYDLLEDIGIDLVLSNPLKTKAIAEAKIKTDTIDARTLADLLRADMIPLVHVPSKEVRAQKRIFFVKGSGWWDLELWLRTVSIIFLIEIMSFCRLTRTSSVPPADVF